MTLSGASRRTAWLTSFRPLWSDGGWTSQLRTSDVKECRLLRSIGVVNHNLLVIKRSDKRSAIVTIVCSRSNEAILGTIRDVLILDALRRISFAYA